MIGGQVVPTHAMAKQLPLSQDVLWTRQSPVVCFICLSGLLRLLRLAMIDRHVKPSPTLKKIKKKRRVLSRWAVELLFRVDVASQLCMCVMSSHF